MKRIIYILIALWPVTAGAQLCGNENACNYNPEELDSVVQDCIFPAGCSDPEAINYGGENTCSEVSKCLYLDACGFTVNSAGERAGFVGDFEASNWTFENYGGTGSVYINPTVLKLFPDTETQAKTRVYMTWFGGGGTLTFDFEYYRTPMSLVTPAFPEYFENGVNNILPWTGNYGLRTGTVEVNIDPGGIFGFELPAEYDVICDGPLLIYNLRFEGEPCVQGCTYPQAENFNPLATLDDGSCILAPSTCEQDLDGDNFVGSADLLVVLGGFGTVCE